MRTLYKQKKFYKFDSESLHIEVNKKKVHLRKVWVKLWEQAQVLKNGLDELWWIVFHSQPVRKVGPDQPDEELSLLKVELEKNRGYLWQ